MRPSDWIALGWVLDWSVSCVAVAFILAGVVLIFREQRGGM